MNAAPLHRRAGGRFVAAVLLTAALAACGTDDPADTSTQSEPGSIPVDHGLPARVAERVLGSTVGIDGVACGVLASGSGFALTETLVVTNAHVIVGIDEIHVHTLDGRDLVGVPVAFDPDNDLAILEVDGADLDPLPLADDAAPGSTGMLVGWESGPAPDPSPYRIERRVTVRIESVGSTERVERPAWSIAAEIDEGDSGGALIDRTGEVVGVAFAASTEGGSIGYAVRSSAIDDLVAAGLDSNFLVPPC